MMSSNADVFGACERWIVEATLSTEHPLTATELDTLSDLADGRDITVATRAGAPGMVFTADVPAGEVLAVHGWALDCAERAGFRRAAVGLVELRVRTPALYQLVALRPDPR